MAKRLGPLTKMRNCQHCGREMLSNVIRQHEPMCMAGPIGDKVRQFLLDRSQHGIIISIREYTQTKAPGMPSGANVARQVGGWGALAQSLGLTYIETAKSRERALKDAAEDEWIDNEPLKFITDEPSQGLPGTEWRLKEIYNWRVRDYEVVASFEVR